MDCRVWVLITHSVLAAQCFGERECKFSNAASLAWAHPRDSSQRLASTIGTDRGMEFARGKMMAFLSFRGVGKRFGINTQIKIGTTVRIQSNEKWWKRPSKYATGHNNHSYFAASQKRTRKNAGARAGPVHRHRACSGTSCARVMVLDSCGFCHISGALRRGPRVVGRRAFEQNGEALEQLLRTRSCGRVLRPRGRHELGVGRRHPVGLWGRMGGMRRQAHTHGWGTVNEAVTSRKMVITRAKE